MTEIYFNNGRVICVNTDVEEIKRALSQTMIRTFQRSVAEEIANNLNGKVIRIPDEITMSEDEEEK